MIEIRCIRTFLRILRDAGVESVKLPPQSPNLNAHAERFVRTIKESNHQGLGNRRIIAPQAEVRIQGAIRRRSRLGGMLNYLLPPGSLTDWEYTVMDVINRSAVIVMPAEPFMKWLHRADSPAPS